MFKAALSTTSKTWEPKCPSTDQWRKMGYTNTHTHTHTHTREYYSAIKRRLFAATWMELETIILSEVNQKEI